MAFGDGSAPVGQSSIFALVQNGVQQLSAIAKSLTTLATNSGSTLVVLRTTTAGIVDTKEPGADLGYLVTTYGGQEVLIPYYRPYTDS